MSKTKPEGLWKIPNVKAYDVAVNFSVISCTYMYISMTSYDHRNISFTAIEVFKKQQLTIISLRDAQRS